MASIKYKPAAILRKNINSLILTLTLILNLTLDEIVFTNLSTEFKPMISNIHFQHNESYIYIESYIYTY